MSDQYRKPISKREKGIKRFDIIVIGGGLAGCAVVWQAIHRGLSIVLIDRNQSATCSRVAAGLVTPITGKRAAASWRWNEFYSQAHSFYSSIESRTGCSFWQVAPALRIFANLSERDLYLDRWSNPNSASESDYPLSSLYQPQVQVYSAADSIIKPSNDEDLNRPNDLAPSNIPRRDLNRPSLSGFHIPYGAGWMAPAARLNTSVYLDATYHYLMRMNAFVEFDLNCDQQIQYRNELVYIDDLDLCGKSIVYCQGFAARESSAFQALPLHPARGDILRIALPRDHYCDSVLHADVWLVPLVNGEYLLGATYDRHTLDNLVDHRPRVADWRNELLSRLKKIAPGICDESSIRLIEQRGAVRPASYDRHPLIGAHPVLPNTYCLNGLGSKGSLMAPALADRLLDRIDGSPIDPQLDWMRKAVRDSKR